MTSVLKPPLSKKLRTPVFILRSEWLTVRVRDSVKDTATDGHTTLYHKDKKSNKARRVPTVAKERFKGFNRNFGLN